LPDSFREGKEFVEFRFCQQPHALAQDEMCLQLHERAAGDSQVMEKFFGVMATLPFGDISRDRSGRSADLAGQAILFRPGK
jgi:hypothetical protein